MDQMQVFFSFLMKEFAALARTAVGAGLARPTIPPWLRRHLPLHKGGYPLRRRFLPQSPSVTAPSW